MLQAPPFPIRTECPPGACVCRRDALLAEPGGDTRILRLTREEEKKLLAHIESIASYAELNKLSERLRSQLGVVLQITPSRNEVKSARGLSIVLEDRPGLCRKTRQAVPSAIRRALERHPDIIYAILDAHDLLGSN
ncbi:hypothetical protein [Massilia genomosp. 1]|uniref:Ribosomal protein S3AE n=1 Tax=Massilia genomosp. 1 TaxID=2609280 RepID=A0ABX0MWA2_9BURK|nr:hypothetical protein [Massilia genomosp. 1]NHZ67036.1 hypothetical protein [Massilia genomosp. 1]